MPKLLSIVPSLAYLTIHRLGCPEIVAVPATKILLFKSIRIELPTTSVPINCIIRPAKPKFKSGDPSGNNLCIKILF